MELTQGENIQEQAYRAAINILQNHQPPELPQGAAGAMQEMIKEFEAAEK